MSSPLATSAPMRPWGSLSVTERVLVLGMPYTGKSTKARELVRDAERVLFFDPAGDYSSYAEPFTCSELLACPEVLAGNGPIAITVLPEADTGRGLAAELAAVAGLARAARNLVLVLDEVGDYGREARATLERLARNGRHDGLATVYVSQCAIDIPRTVRRLATRVISFLQVDPDDLDALETRCGAEFRSRVRAWKPGDPPADWVLPSMERRK